MYSSFLLRALEFEPQLLRGSPRDRRIMIGGKIIPFSVLMIPLVGEIIQKQRSCSTHVSIFGLIYT